MRTIQKHPALRSIVIGAIALTLGGCATFSKDGGLDAVSSMTTERIGQDIRLPRGTSAETEAQEELSALLKQPLTADHAVRVALLNNRGLRASLAELGVAEADLVQAGRMANPSFSFGRMKGHEETEIERSVMFDLVGLITIPLRRDIEGRRFESAKLVAATEAVRTAADTRKAWFNAVAAAQSARYAEQVREAAQASAELATRMAKVGNLSALDQAREQAFSAEATTQLARARHNAMAAREQLARLMGVWGANVAFQLPDRLPDLPGAPREPGSIEALAMQQRLDVQLAKLSTQATARALGLSKATGFVNVLEAGYVNASKSGEPRENGYEIELALPLFDWGGARIAKAEALYMQSVHRTADTAISARSQVREAYSAYRTSYDVAKHYRDEIVPLRKKISEETLLRYNGMLMSVFELLADARAQISGVNAAIEAQRDYWIADTDLQAAINGTGGATARMAGGASAEAAAPAH
ncbi:TolC family protein [Massilia sp. LC238]|jgi:outer membrane protein TolC|uniref:TolC family protein n=2 Tax=Massilia TaxID=149698 RepID=UPI0004E418AA|nr:TolC family protein [Massilia sp. LC238]KFC63480.1 Outer membrane efflux protein [Massilia sp. LC238]